MAKFEVGARVQVPSDTQQAPVFWLGRQGTVRAVIETPPPGAQVPFNKLVQGYAVQFDGEEHWAGVPESCLRAS